ncbi:DNA polymerase III subunit epsilon [Kaistia algarum]|uniref:DNA polymerase III subunit epsilon n=1 Tax=Kaistia algarum TaxID=2083279 RepID=UPI000CE8E6D1|nr:DNA polymerase III subunit epsilon [Kaistia algarum]MCX5513855.1 DNA polymerase III subunit epsilon [Kaistia algarum]PPE79286.1 DNA polymerase III subunit epsilon [Kaistia algarum]
MREIVFDTETTGLEPLKGDRLVEIGGIELLNHIPTGRSYHVYVNPERSMPVEAFRVHGLSDEFLADKPLFRDVVDDFIAFIEGATLIAHNATFDISFINAEFARLSRPPIPPDRVIDTLMLARRKHPAGPNSLDALCSRYGIDTSKRTLHGGLLDAELLAEVYIELIGGRQPDLVLVRAEERTTSSGIAGSAVRRPLVRPAPLAPRGNEEEFAAHEAFVGKIKDALWSRYAAAEAE